MSLQRQLAHVRSRGDPVGHHEDGVEHDGDAVDQQRSCLRNSRSRAANVRSKARRMLRRRMVRSNKPPSRAAGYFRRQADTRTRLYRRGTRARGRHRGGRPGSWRSERLGWAHVRRGFISSSRSRPITRVTRRACHRAHARPSRAAAARSRARTSTRSLQGLGGLAAGPSAEQGV
jgi:hypothetical protein